LIFNSDWLTRPSTIKFYCPDKTWLAEFLFLKDTQTGSYVTPAKRCSPSPYSVIPHPEGQTVFLSLRAHYIPLRQPCDDLISQFDILARNVLPYINSAIRRTEEAKERAWFQAKQKQQLKVP